MARVRARALGVQLRPHAKTHKCLEIARLQMDENRPCLTVSTLAEARYFMDGGIRDLCLAVPLAPCHIDGALDLARESESFSVLVDHEATVRQLIARAAARSQRISTWLKIDCGYHRAGVDPLGDQLIPLAQTLSQSPWTDFKGLLAHGGHAYEARSSTEILPYAIEERDQVLSCADRLRECGIEVPLLSVGSTPTLKGVDHLRGIDELRPGNYIFFDRSQVAIGACRSEDIAVSVLTTVIGHYPQRNCAIVDAGALALSKDAGDGCDDFGEICDLDGQPLKGLHLYRLSQEHGKITSEPGASLPPIHSRLRIRPNHSCLTAALFSEYHVHRGTEVHDIWSPIRGWTLAHGRR
jgi:D-serine deaminase-like pyridoxal phosphate-dependent protein